MSQTPQTPDTKDNTSNALRRRGRPSKSETTSTITEEVVKEIVEQPAKAIETHEPAKNVISIDLANPHAIGRPNPSQTEEDLRLAAKLVHLETFIAYANQNKIEWGEVEPDILKHFNKGELPEAGYIIYKNIKLCLAGEAEKLAARDNLTCHQVLFPQESYMKVGVKVLKNGK